MWSACYYWRGFGIIIIINDTMAKAKRIMKSENSAFVFCSKIWAGHGYYSTINGAFLRCIGLIIIIVVAIISINIIAILAQYYCGMPTLRGGRAFNHYYLCARQGIWRILPRDLQLCITLLLLLILTGV